MKIKIKDNNILPIYYQIYQQLKEYIDNKKIKSGEKLPSERELEKLLGVSRVTIRKAIKDLISNGFCFKKRGKGIFVSKKRIKFEMEAVKGITNRIKSLGMEIITEIISKKILQCNTTFAGYLEVPIKSKILYLKRLRLINKEPLIVENTYLSLDRMPKLEKNDFRDSLYEIIKEKYGFYPNHAKGSIISKLVSEENSKLLNIPLNFPVIEKKVIVYTKNNIPIEFVKGFYCSNRFEFIYNSFFCDS